MLKNMEIVCQQIIDVIELDTLNLIIVYECLVLDRSTWNHISVNSWLSL